MIRRARHLAAALIAIALGLAPLAADACALSCDASHARPAVPSCHHTSAATERVSHPAGPCSHDHHPVVVDGAAANAIALRAPAAAEEAGPVVPDVRSLLTAAAATPQGRDLSPPLTLTLASILRI